MTTRRSSMLIVSVIVHVTALVAVVVLSALAPALLPAPARHIVWAHEAPRPVRLVDIQLQPQTRPTRTSQPATQASVPAVAAPSNPAPVVAPTALPTADPGADAGPGRPDVSAVESGSGNRSSFDGLVVNEEPPAIVERERPAPVRLHSGIQAPRKVVDVPPTYPVLARTAGIQGIVILELVIDERGAVTAARVLRSVTLLDQAALDAVNRWRFEPARLNGAAIPVVMTVTVNFRLDR